jgi:rRNA maturation endonuclease Nob1
MTREEAIEMLKALNMMLRSPDGEPISDVCDALGMAIKALSADTEGEWIDVDNYYRLATCSRCHKVTMFEKWGEYTKPYDFCPNCGARMKGGDTE